MNQYKCILNKERIDYEDTDLVQTFTQKYTIVQFFDDIYEGYEYSSDSWPLHSTIVDTFAITWSVDEMVNQLEEVLKDHAIAKSEAGDDRLFGENRQIRVVLLNRSSSLIKLHQDILTILEKGGLKLNDPQFARDGFLPHATVQRHARLNKGDKVQFTALSIVDMFPNKDPRKRRVLKTITIGG